MVYGKQCQPEMPLTGNPLAVNFQSPIEQGYALSDLRLAPHLTEFRYRSLLTVTVYFIFVLGLNGSRQSL
jgi:hypothetical protein